MIVDDSGNYMLHDRVLHEKQAGRWVVVERFTRKITIDEAVAEYEKEEDHDPAV